MTAEVKLPIRYHPLAIGLCDSKTESEIDLKIYIDDFQGWRCLPHIFLYVFICIYLKYLGYPNIQKIFKIENKCSIITRR